MDVWRSCNPNIHCRRNQREPEGKRRRGEGRCRNRSNSPQEERKEKLLFFESSERCQNRERSNSWFVSSHCRAERLSVQTSVGASRVNSDVTLGVTCAGLRGSDSLGFLHFSPSRLTPLLHHHTAVCYIEWVNTGEKNLESSSLLFFWSGEGL